MELGGALHPSDLLLKGYSMTLPFNPLLIKSYVHELPQQATKSPRSNVWSSGNLIIEAKE